MYAVKRNFTFFERLFIWRRMNFSEQKFILMISFVVGVLTAFAGLFLKWLIHQIQYLLTYRFDATGSNALYLVYPVIGIFLTGLFVRYVVKDDISHGVTKILFAIARKQSKIKAHNTWSSVIASAITIGFGGSVGAEAPIVLTGSAIGSNLGRLFRINSKTLMLLVGCGAAGAVAGIFKAPIAGLVFTLEVLMIDLTMGALLPLLISCVTAAGVTFAVSGTNTIFEFHLQNGFAVDKIPAYILLGIFCGLVSLYFTRTMNSLEDIFRKYSNPYVKLLIGGATLSILIYLFPSLYGEGYDLINLLLNGNSEKDWDTAMDSSLFYGHGNLLLLYLALVLIFKVFASTATNGGGGCGGIFAPSLFLGCISGFIFARLWNFYRCLGIYLPERNFAMIGMAGLMSGVMHAPLTGIFLIAELTGGYQLFMPLMILRTRQLVVALPGVGAYLQSLRLHGHQRRRRLWRYFRPQPVFGLYLRLYFRPPLELLPLSGHLLARTEFCHDRYGGTDEWRHARPADRHIPYRGTHRRLSAIHAPDDCIRLCLPDHYFFRAPQHLFHAFGQKRPVAHAP